jgi:phage shock protein PspC (stress-responsive transcriptional regulator)
LDPDLKETFPMNRRLYRSRRDSVIGGVAGGVAEYLDVDPSIVRIIWAILAIVTGGVFVLIYIVMWVVVPEGPPAGVPPAPGTPDVSPPAGSDPGATPPPAYSPAWGGPPPRHRTGGLNGALVFGLILIGVGIGFLNDEFLPDIDSRFVWPVALVVIGLVILAGSLRRPRAE